MAGSGRLIGALGLSAFGWQAGTILAGGSVNCPAGVSTQISISPLPTILDPGTYDISAWGFEDILFGATLPTALSFTFQVTQSATGFQGTDLHGVNPLLYGSGGGASQANNLWRYPHVNHLSAFGATAQNGSVSTLPATATMLVTPTGSAVHIVRAAGSVGQQVLFACNRQPD